MNFKVHRVTGNWLPRIMFRMLPASLPSLTLAKATSFWSLGMAWLQLPSLSFPRSFWKWAHNSGRFHRMNICLAGIFVGTSRSVDVEPRCCYCFWNCRGGEVEISLAMTDPFPKPVCFVDSYCNQWLRCGLGVLFACSCIGSAVTYRNCKKSMGKARSWLVGTLSGPWFIVPYTV